MKYLKFILTIIAFNLTIIMLQKVNIIPEAKASIKETMEVNIAEIGGKHVPYGRMQVEIGNEVGVNCSNCQ